MRRECGCRGPSRESGRRCASTGSHRRSEPSRRRRPHDRDGIGKPRPGGPAPARSSPRRPEIELDTRREDTRRRLSRRDPALSGDAEAILDLIYQEYVLRRDRGENPVPDEFFARFPDHAGSLLLQFGVDAAMTPTTCIPRTSKLGRTTMPTSPSRPSTATRSSHMLGRGGMGIVYKARDPKLGRIVAIKMIAEGRHATPDQLDRFRAEAHAVARLHHPNIIAIHAIGEHDDRPYLSLEFAEGGSLASGWPRSPWPRDEAAELVETLARAVHAAHQAGVVHRDLKPAQRPPDGRRNPQGQRLRPGQAPRRRLGAYGLPASRSARRATWPPSRPRAIRNRSARPPTSTHWERSSTRR